MLTQTLVLTDPLYVPKSSPGLFHRVAMVFLKDPRDIPFARLIVGLLAVFPASAAFILSTRENVFWFAIPYWVVFFGVFMGPFTLMLHNVSHRPFVKGNFRSLQSLVINWILGPLFGHTPHTYFAHHIGMHHIEGNLPGDLSSTLYYQRDRPVDFLKYFGKFFASSIFELSQYHLKRQRKKMFLEFLVGEVAYFAVAAAFTWWNWRGAVVVFWAPLLILRFGMMAGNWAQHAFIDLEQPDNIYRNSITVINAKYNQNCFNDGYHIGHHLKSNRHWTDMPIDFLENRHVYAEQDAVVFRRIDYFGIWLFLMLGRFDWLAHFFVDLREHKRTREEVMSFLKSRVQKATDVKKPLVPISAPRNSIRAESAMQPSPL